MLKAAFATLVVNNYTLNSQELFSESSLIENVFSFAAFYTHAKGICCRSI